MSQAPLQLFYFATPNGHKITIALEELGLDYEINLVDITDGEQRESDFRSISPNCKIPVLIDSEGPDGCSISLFESNVILTYLARKMGDLYPFSARAQLEVDQWLCFQAAHIGPTLARIQQLKLSGAEETDQALNDYIVEAHRLYQVLDTRLSERHYLCDDYSIADIATYSWIRLHEQQHQNILDTPYLHRWCERIASRAAVQRGLAAAVHSSIDADALNQTSTSWQTLFGSY